MTYPPQCSFGNYVGDVGTRDDVGRVYETADAGDEGPVCKARSVSLQELMRKAWLGIREMEVEGYFITVVL